MQENAIKEVEHLQRLQHSHIVRAIGTYIIGKDLILLYPVAEYNLEIFIDHIYESTGSESAARLVDWETCLFAEFFDKKPCLPAFFGCLSRACNTSIPMLPNIWILNPKTP